MIARRAVISGRVQGVGFRFFAQRAARDNSIRGWVRNLPDGSVETVAEGDEDAVALYLESLRRGPMGARVTGLSAVEVPANNYTSFEITR
jgi:acylphosphatase